MTRIGMGRRMVVGGLLLVGCAPAEEDASCTVSADLSAGTAQATVDGVEWRGSGVEWNAAGDDLQITTNNSDGWRLTVVARGRGEPNDDSAPVDLSGDDGWVLAYPDSGLSYSTKDGGSGTLTIVEHDQDVRACITFEAHGDDGSVTFEAGTLHALPMNL